MTNIKDKSQGENQCRCLCFWWWENNSVELNHNHSMSPSKARFYSCHRTISAIARRRLQLNDDGGIRLNKSYSTFLVEASGHENVSFSEKDA